MIKTVRMIECPTGTMTADGDVHTIVGCGAMIPDIRDLEGLVDCPECGIFFNPEQEQ